MNAFSAISKRLKYDKKPLLNLNHLQTQIKKRIEGKVDNSIYNLESYSCPICDSNIFSTLANKDRYGLYMSTSICNQCGLIQTNPCMDHQSFETFYKEEYRKLYVGKETATNTFFFEQQTRGARIYKYIKSSGVNCENVLEVGCGAGGILKYFKDRGSNIFGLDIDGEYIKYGIEIHDLNLEARRLSFSDGNFNPDLIIYSHALEHIKEIDNELDMLNQISNENTKIYIEVPGVKNLHNSYGMDLGKYLQNAHVYHFSLASLENIMSKHGFTLIKGDEGIKALFKKNSVEHDHYKSDFNAVSQYLYGIEKKFQSPFNFIYKIKKMPKETILFILKKINLYNLFVKLIYRIK